MFLLYVIRDGVTLLEMVRYMCNVVQVHKVQYDQILMSSVMFLISMDPVLECENADGNFKPGLHHS